MIGKANFHTNWEEWRSRVRMREFNPAHAWPGPYATPQENLPDLFGTNPLQIKNLTNSLLLNLKPVRCRERTSFETRFFGLPLELRSAIIDSLPCRDLPRVTTGLLPQSFWLNLLQPDALPWLWELSPEVFLQKAEEACPGGRDFEWNWELLFRQLTRGVDFGVLPDVPNGTPLSSGFRPDERTGACGPETLWGTTGYYDDLEYVPPGLFNRRRIWQLVEEMFVGDMLPRAFGGDSMALGFQKSGPRFVFPEYIQIPWGNLASCYENQNGCPRSN
uniref:Uncharacterized protein n=1 Tax=Bionectria ochroleuca TaxID=29856 RepID=A0A8H7TP81_BIOOC